jgi:hypothetical protein
MQRRDYVRAARKKPASAWPACVREKHITILHNKKVAEPVVLTNCLNWQSIYLVELPRGLVCSTGKRLYISQSKREKNWMKSYLLEVDSYVWLVIPSPS